MEIRVLKYFLMVAREENITRAAALLHLTQPTLSRQLIQLEKELGTQLFHRSKHRVVLTDDGMLLKRRAQEIVSLAEKTEQEFARHHGGELTGEIMIGCGETQNMTFLSRRIAAFRGLHPLVRYNIYSASADDIKDRLEKGILDMGLLLEPVDMGKYDFIRLPDLEQWGVLVRKDSPLCQKTSVSPADLADTPILLSQRESVQNELANWFGDYFDRIEIAATYNLLLNAANMVKNGVGAAICFRLLEDVYGDLRFIPFSPSLQTGAVLVWKKNQAFSPVVSRFIQYIRDDAETLSPHNGTEP